MKKTYHTVNGQIIYETTPGASSPDNITTYGRDAFGSLVAGYGGTGEAAFTARYKPYGEFAASTGAVTGKRFLWAGSWGYRFTQGVPVSHYVRARHYSMRMGLWNTVDPWWPDEKPFQYAEGNPYSWIDPSGRFAIAAPIAIGGVGSGVLAGIAVTFLLAAVGIVVVDNITWGRSTSSSSSSSSSTTRTNTSTSSPSNPNKNRNRNSRPPRKWKRSTCDKLNEFYHSDLACGADIRKEPHRKKLEPCDDCNFDQVKMLRWCACCFLRNLALKRCVYDAIRKNRQGYTMLDRHIHPATLACQECIKCARGADPLLPPYYSLHTGPWVDTDNDPV